MKQFQCKDVPDMPVLLFLASLNGKWGNWYYGTECSVCQAMPADTPGKVVLAKMRTLIRRGLVDGCGCGCRGDFVLTDKGRQFIDTNILCQRCGGESTPRQGRCARCGDSLGIISL